MGRPKKVQEVVAPESEVINEPIVETIEPIVEVEPEKVETTPEVTVVGDVESTAKTAFRAYIEKYKAEKPAKYEYKKAELEDKLNKLV